MARNQQDDLDHLEESDVARANYEQLGTRIQHMLERERALDLFSFVPNPHEHREGHWPKPSWAPSNDYIPAVHIRRYDTPISANNCSPPITVPDVAILTSHLSAASLSATDRHKPFYELFGDRILYPMIMVALNFHFSHLCGGFALPSYVHDSLRKILNSNEAQANLCQALGLLRLVPPSLLTNRATTVVGFLSGIFECYFASLVEYDLRVYYGTWRTQAFVIRLFHPAVIVHLTPLVHLFLALDVRQGTNFVLPDCGTRDETDRYIFRPAAIGGL